MHPVHYLIQSMLETASDGVQAECQPLPEQGTQVQHPRLSVHADHVQIDTVVAFQIGGGEQVVHQLLEINPVGTRHNDQPGGVFMVRLVSQVFYHGQLFGLHLLRDLLQDFCG